MKAKRVFGRITSVITASALAFAAAFSTAGCSKTAASSTVIINEVLASNQYAFAAADGSSPDVIELYNTSSEKVELSGCGLTDKADEPHLFTFPEGAAINPGEYLVVYCTGTNDTENEDGVYRAGFKISSEGENIMFTDASGNALSVLYSPEMPTDVSYGYDGEKYVYYKTPTIGEENSGETNDTGVFEYDDVTETVTLSINEYMTGNEYSAADASGERSSWVELKNTGSQSVNLKGLCLSDDDTNPTKWVFPEKELGAGELAVVYLSGKDSAENGELHTSFAFSDSDAYLSLNTANGKTIASVPYEATGGMISIGTDASGSAVYYPISTPGEENGEGFSSLEEAESYLPEVYISEIKSTTEDKIDWIELHNRSGEAADLSGWGLSDDRNNIYRFTFDGTTIGAGEYLVISCKGGEGSLVTDFGIKKASERIYLSNDKGVITDTLNGGWQSGDISRGRTEEDNTAYFFAEATKGTANTSESFSTYASDPVFSVPGGYVDSGTSVTVTAGEGETVYYTLDGSEPTKSSSVYSSPIAISSTCTLRAAAYAEGKLKSAVTTENYITGEKHSLPVVCVSMNPYDFSSDEAGIYAKGAGYYDWDGVDYTHPNSNYWQDWEKEINFEYFEADGAKGVSFDAGIKIFGQYSRELPKKSFAIYLRGKYGISETTYPFFRDNDVTTFSSLVLRQSGQDWGTTLIKDAFIGAAVKNEMSIDSQDYRPVVLYINGEYWGIYNIREKLNEDYLVNKYGAEKGKVDLLKADTHPQAGKNDGWMEVRKYIKDRYNSGGASALDNSDVTAWLNERVDMQSQYEWVICETFFYNSDTGNLRDYCIEGGKWRKMLYDNDHALKTGGYNWQNWLLDEVMNDKGHGHADLFQSHIFMPIKYNSTFRNEFIECYANHLNTTLQTDRLCAIIDAMADEIRPEMERNCARWGSPESVEKWEANIEEMKNLIAARRPYAIKEIQTTFNLSDSRMNELFPNG